MSDLVEVEQAGIRQDQPEICTSMMIFLANWLSIFLSPLFDIRYLSVIVQQGVDIDRQGPVHDRDILAGILTGGRFKEAEQLALIDYDLL